MSQGSFHAVADEFFLQSPLEVHCERLWIQSVVLEEVFRNFSLEIGQELGEVAEIISRL
jgi:hypothetical protein